MKKFFKKIVLMLVILSVCLTSVFTFNFFVIGNQYKYNYQASVIDKTDRLKSIDEPKIILVGNSNVCFGMNSEILEKEIGMPVVDLGLHGGLGNAFHENFAKKYINKGDIVVVCHSSYSDDDIINDPELAWITFDNNIDLLYLFRIKDYPRLLTAYPEYFRKSFELWVKGIGNQGSDDCYSREAFNKYGDITFKPEFDQMDVDRFFETKKIEVCEANDICVNRLNDLYKYCNEKEASMVVAGYPVAYGKYADFTKQDFDKFQNQLESSLDCEVISRFTDYFYPYSYFYNSFLHLTKEGANVRTEQLAKDLKNWLEKN